MKVSRENCPVKPLIGKMKREKIVLKHREENLSGLIQTSHCLLTLF